MYPAHSPRNSPMSPSNGLNDHSGKGIPVFSELRIALIAV